jgi:phosphotransferase system enzyme I (PtsI)
MTLAMAGQAVESGIAVGQAHIIESHELEIAEYRIPAEGIDAEIARLEAALQAARGHLENLVSRLTAAAGTTTEEIIRTHIMMLSDAAISQSSKDRIREQECNAEWALQLQLNQLQTEFRQIEDSYIASRADDAAQVVRLVQKFLATDAAPGALETTSGRLAQTLVVASELTPGEVAMLGERGIAGFITEHGSPYSHTAILARSLGIPTVMGVRRAQSLIKEGEQLVLDGHYGIVLADPEEKILRHYLEKQAESERFKQSLEAIRDRPTRSLDGKTIRLMANAERTNEFELARRDGALGVGLYRSEFLFLQGGPPGEEEQYTAYREALATLVEGPLVIRTLDIGADKDVDLVDYKNLRNNPNPALGLRAVRLCLRELDLFKTQLRAILRTSAHGEVSCMIPMLTSEREVLAVRSLIEEIKDELTEKGLAFNPDMPLGGMIEVPAAALAIRELGRHLDFISIGTNDLIQYALATDRVDESVAHLYEPQHPGVVHLLRHIFRSASEAAIPVAVCGEMAGDRRYTRLLLALGLREFSMQPRSLLEVKQVIMETDVARAEAALQEWLQGGYADSGITLVNFLDNSQIRR